MSSGPDPGPTPSPPPEAAVRSALERVLASSGFSRAPRLRSLLSYVVEESLAGRSGNLKEYSLGVEVFSRSESFDPRTDTIVRVECRRLRRRLEEYYLGEGSADAVRIELPKGGYAAAFSQSASGPDAAPSAPSRLSAYFRAGASWVGAAVVLVLGVALLLWGSVVLSPPSVAVLPFENLTGDPTDEVLAQGLVDEMIDILTRETGIRTIARGSSRKASASANRLKDAGERLGVANLVSGNVRRDGRRLRVTAQLIRVSDGSSLWSGSYEREAAGPFEIEDELSKLIAGEVSTRLGARREPRGQDYVPSPAVSRLYLHGRHLWNQRTPSGVRDSIRFFDEAIEKDPGFALAHAALADSWAVLAMNEQAPVADAANRAKSAAAKALEIDPSLGEARATDAWLRFFHDWEFDRARGEFDNALRLRPGYATARQWFGLALLSQGEFEPAVRQFEKALELDPLSLIMITDLAVARYYQRRYDAAIARAREALRLDSRFHFAQLILGASLLQQGRRDEAVAMMRNAVENSGRDPDCQMRLGHALALAGRREEAETILEDLERTGSHHQRAFLRLGLGQYDRALDHLEQSLLLREPSLLFARVEPAFDPLRRMRRFQNLLAAVEKPSGPLKAALPGH